VVDATPRPLYPRNPLYGRPVSTGAENLVLTGIRFPDRSAISQWLYVILTAFPLQEWLQERTSMLRETYIACLVQANGTMERGKVRRLRPSVRLTNVHLVLSTVPARPRSWTHLAVQFTGWPHG